MKIIILTTLLFTLTGCWNYNELNDIAITTGLAIDKTETGYEATVLIANSKKGSDSGSIDSQAVSFSDTGETIYEAVKNVGLSVSKQLYFGHLELLVLSEEIASLGTEEVIDFLFRYPQVRNDFLLVVAKGDKAGKIFEITTSLETFPSQNISKNLLTTNESSAITYNVNLNNYVTILTDEGINPVLPSVEIIGEEIKNDTQETDNEIKPNTYLKLGTLAIFKKDKFITYSTPEQSKGISIINNQVETLVVTTDCENGKTASEVTQSETKYEIKDNKITLTTEMIGTLQETSCELDINDSKTIEEIENQTKEELIIFMEDAINLAKENKTDIFGFGQYLFRNNYNYYKEIETTWDEEIFLNYEIEIKLNLDLKSKGNANNLIEVRE